MLAQPLAAACSSRRPGGQLASVCFSMSLRKPRYAVAELVIRFRFRFSMKSAQTCGSAHSGFGKSTALHAGVSLPGVWVGVGVCWGSGGRKGAGAGKGEVSVTVTPMSRDCPVTVTSSPRSLARWRRLRSAAFARPSATAACAASIASTAIAIASGLAPAADMLRMRSPIFTQRASAHNSEAGR